MLSLVAFDPRILLAYAAFGDVVDVRARLVDTLTSAVGQCQSASRRLVLGFGVAEL